MHACILRVLSVRLTRDLIALNVIPEMDLDVILYMSFLPPPPCD